MKILFLSISYSENDHISFYEELLQEFIHNNHELYVACACEKKKKEKTYFNLERNINVLHIRTGNITGNINIIEKGLSTIMIDKTFKRNIKKHFKDIKFDLILYATPPITFVGTISYFKKKTNSYTYLLLKDIFPQNALDLGMLNRKNVRGLIYDYFRKKEKELYKVSDYIGCMSLANVQYVLNNNNFIDKTTIEVCPNCVKLLSNSISKEQQKELKKKHNIPLDKKIFIYGGNLGKPQGISFFLNCIEACKDIEEAFILIVGGGSEAFRIKKFIKNKNIKNAKLLDILPKRDYEQLVQISDVGLILLDYNFTIPNFPSRILSYMQASKPVLAATDPYTDIGEIVESNGFGWKCFSNNVNEFKTCINKALNSDLILMGEKSRKYLEENYSVNESYKIIAKHFI